MIDPEERLYAGSGSLMNGGPYTWHITDLDARRYFSVTYAPKVPLTTDEELEETEEICMTQLRNHIDDLHEGIVGIRFSDPTGPITTSSNPADDVTQLVNCRRMTDLQLGFSFKTISISQLTELDRLGPQVDLVEYNESPRVATGQAISETLNRTKAVFKYWFMENGMFRTWYELNNWIQLPRNHPHIVPFDCVVLDSVRGGIIGFTSLFIPGGTLRDKNATARPFCLRWLHQLLSVTNDLNYHYGIMHQDIAPRNLIIDEQDNLRIFDFNYSIMIGEHYSCDMDDIKGIVFTLYEIVTLNTHLRDCPPSEQDAEALLRMEWVKHPEVKLDHDVHFFRQSLDNWVKERKAREFKRLDTWLSWPRLPDPPKVQVPTLDHNGEIIGSKMGNPHVLFRKDLVKLGEPFWNWQRPPSYSLTEALANQCTDPYSAERSARDDEPTSVNSKGK